ncbi:MAG: guanylate kinase [Muribaculaceae bacterium]|nr:guanylate kinase [Muribaculaceae bacterium]
MKQGKVIIISAPSGCGKSTIIKALRERGNIDMGFSVSATNREPRPGEKDGEHYYFLTTEQFREAIDRGDFVEYEEVYPGRYYGTLRSEIDRITGEGHNVVLDIDVKGGERVKKLMGDRAISLFILPPSVDELRRRLEGRGTDAPDVIDQRVGRAEFELSFAPRYDCRVVNDDLQEAVDNAERILKEFVDAE